MAQPTGDTENAEHDQRADDNELEVTPLDQRPTRTRLPDQPGQQSSARRLALALRSKPWRVALTVCAIALTIVAPLVSLAPTRALIFGRAPTPAPTVTPESNGALTIVNVATSTTDDIAPAAWDSLRARPLRLPTLAPGATCPAAQGRIVEPAFGPAIGAGPVYIVGAGTNGVLQATAPDPTGKGSATWGNQFAFFVIAPSYRGPALARGHQLDGPHALLFNGGLDQMSGFTASTPTLLSQLRLEGSPAFGAPWPNFAAYLRMQAPGCYGVQLDGLNFSETIIFRIIYGQ